MLTTKQLRIPLSLPRREAIKTGLLLKTIAFAGLAIVVAPSVTALVNHQVRLQAAGGRSCFRVNAARTNQVRKYGSDCDL